MFGKNKEPVLSENDKIAGAIQIYAYNKDREKEEVIEIVKKKQQLPQYLPEATYKLSQSIKMASVGSYIYYGNEVKAQIEQIGTLSREMVKVAREKAEKESKKRGETQLQDKDVIEQIDMMDMDELVKKLRQKEEKQKQDQI